MDEGRSARPAAPDRERPPASPDWVLEVLEPDQLVAHKHQPFGLRRLSRGTRALMWCLRGYVVFMLVVVAYQAFGGAH